MREVEHAIPKMKYGEIPHVGKKVSRILMGTASAPFTAGEDGNELLDAVYALGINTFDTARVYGASEQVLGKWIAERGLRDQVVILSKCAHPAENGERRVNARAIREDFATSARCLQTEHIDIYLLHRDDPTVEVGEIVELLNAMHAEGKIGAFGGSNWTHERIATANEYAYKHDLIPFAVSSPHFSLAEQITDLWGGGCVAISGPSHRAARAWYEKAGMPVIAYSSLARGLFSGKLRADEPERAGEVLDDWAMKGYASPENFERLRRCEKLAEEKGCTVPQIALAWIFGQRLNLYAVISASAPGRMRGNIDALAVSLTEAELLYLDEV